jgi:hypothetical protein
MHLNSEFRLQAYNESGLALQDKSLELGSTRNVGARLQIDLNRHAYPCDRSSVRLDNPHVDPEVDVYDTIMSQPPMTWHRGGGRHAKGAFYVFQKKTTLFCAALLEKVIFFIFTLLGERTKTMRWPYLLPLPPPLLLFLHSFPHCSPQIPCALSPEYMCFPTLSHMLSPAPHRAGPDDAAAK